MAGRARLSPRIPPVLPRLFREYVGDVQRRTDAMALGMQLHDRSGASERRVVIVTLTVLLCLFGLRFFGASSRIHHWIDLASWFGVEAPFEALRDWIRSGPDRQFRSRLFWATARAVAYLLIPGLVIRFLLRGRMRDYGLRAPRDWGDTFRVYGLMYVAVMPFVILVSYSPAFQSKYPYYKPGPDEPLWPYFWGWEVLYAIQFVGLEFFYRGFLVHGLKHRLGFSAVYVMMLPYLMIHFGKPPAEALGSIIAGFVLGTLSLKTGSVWGGAALHVAVATSMDLLSLAHRGLLFG